VGVLIIGAGPTGLGAATRIQQHGLSNWLIIDKVCWASGGSVFASHFSLLSVRSSHAGLELNQGKSGAVQTAFVKRLFNQVAYFGQQNHLLGFLGVRCSLMDCFAGVDLSRWFKVLGADMNMAANWNMRRSIMEVTNGLGLLQQKC
jgi:hypothetical protein